MQSNFFVILGNQLFEPDYLIKNGYPVSDNDNKKIYKSIYAYNHADNYVKAVLSLSEEIRRSIDKK